MEEDKFVADGEEGVSEDGKNEGFEKNKVREANSYEVKSKIFLSCTDDMVCRNVIGFNIEGLTFATCYSTNCVIGKRVCYRRYSVCCM